jgi:hypothetical protein
MKWRGIWRGRQVTERLFHFECPVCGFDDNEAGSLASESQIYCGLCAEDNGKDVLLKRRLAETAE